MHARIGHRAPTCVLRRTPMQTGPVMSDLMNRGRERPLLLAAAVLVVVLVLSGLNPYDRATWVMEALPVAIALPLMALTWRRFPLTTLLYTCIFFHALILLGGAYWSYARVPAGDWVKVWFDLSRNPYDKLGHLAQGFVPALVAREILLRGGHVRGHRMLAFIAVSIALAISASYELIEWIAALVMGQGADDFLGTQGDVWDTQSDMACALVGATVALLTFARLQDRQVRALGPGGRFRTGAATEST